MLNRQIEYSRIRTSVLEKGQVAGAATLTVAALMVRSVVFVLNRLVSLLEFGANRLTNK